MVQWLRIHLPVQGVRVWSLVGELRSHTPCGQKNQSIKQKQYYNTLNKDCKNGPHEKKILKKNAVRSVTLSEGDGVGFTTLGCGESFSIFVQDG